MAKIPSLNSKERPGPKKNGWRYNSSKDLWERWEGGKVVESVTGIMARFLKENEAVPPQMKRAANVIFKEKK